MANVLELLELLRNPGEGVDVPDTIYDDITNAYNEREGEFTALGEGYDNKVRELEGEISRLKSMNYDLLIASGAGAGGDNSSSDDESNDSDNGAADEDAGIDDLFD